MECGMRSKHFTQAASVLVLGGLMAIAGCGGKEAAKSTVKGRVFYRGEPLKGGAIVFAPDADRGNSGSLANGIILDDGTFSLSSDRARGVAPGWYRVSIAARPSSGSAIATVANPYPGPPSRYRNPQLSGINSEVRAGIENVFEFQLDD
jgi:hypothetical protein